jgi:hypothetical protein
VIIGSSSEISGVLNCRCSSGVTERILSKIDFPLQQCNEQRLP